jgi:hypothetical protein
MTLSSAAPSHHNSVILSGASRLHREAQSKNPDTLDPAPTARTFLAAPARSRSRAPSCLSFSGCHSAAKRRNLLLYCGLILLLTFTAHAHAQGCAQCLDNTQATPPAVQAAYRHAIILLAASAATLFTAGTLLLRRNR